MPTCLLGQVDNGWGLVSRQPSKSKTAKREKHMRCEYAGLAIIGDAFDSDNGSIQMIQKSLTVKIGAAVKKAI